MHSILNSRCFSLIPIIIFLSSCTATTEVQLYTEYLSRAESNNIVQLLENHNYRVVLNDFPIPRGLKRSTLIYSPMHRDIASVESLAKLLSNTPHGLPQLELTGKENHFYTKNIVGLYVVPANVISNKEEGIHPIYAIEYSGICDTIDADLDLKKDGSFQLTANIWNDEQKVEYSTGFEGKWTYSDETIFLTLEGNEPVGFSVLRFMT